MSRKSSCGAAIIVLIAAIYGFVYTAMQHNLAATAAALANKPLTIVLDAGHGGEDGGAVSVSGTKESHLNLDIVLRIEQVMALCGMRTELIRSEDVSVHSSGDTISQRKNSDLKNRVSFVEQHTPAILVSIHQNHFSDGRYSGAQVFYADTEESKQLADLMQQSLCAGLDPSNHRKSKQADSVYLMDQISCTGVLVECGFLSNSNEAQLLNTEDYQIKIACVVSSTLSRFMEGRDIFEV